MPKLSIIIPVYNAAKTITKCIDSLLNQTFANMEVIIVDDHGADDSIAIIQNRIAEHPRKSMFRFAKTDVNSGPGAARNVGLQMAQGEYVAFVDSDDWVETDMYATLYEMAVQHSADICYSYVFWEDLGKHRQRILTTVPVRQGPFFGENKRHFLTKFKCHFWAYIYRREFLNTYHITFPLEKGLEDNYFLACCILCAQRIAYVSKPMYHYAYYPNSLSNSKNEKRYLDKLSVFGRLFDFAKTRKFYEEYARELQFVYIKKAYLIAALNFLTNAKHPRAKVLREIYQELITVCPDYKSNPLYKSHFFLRILVIVLHRMPHAACVVFPLILKLRTRQFQ